MYHSKSCCPALNEITNRLARRLLLQLPAADLLLVAEGHIARWCHRITQGCPHGRVAQADGSERKQRLFRKDAGVVPRSFCCRRWSNNRPMVEWEI
jgi:hypothetical protein